MEALVVQDTRAEAIVRAPAGGFVGIICIILLGMVCWASIIRGNLGSTVPGLQPCARDQHLRIRLRAMPDASVYLVLGRSWNLGGDGRLIDPRWRSLSGSQHMTRHLLSLS